ncbi:MAG: hypothetical protein EZS28_007957 [Streblomastix strix]|uniref:Uncharacterized protein n=1 Tax=Streblomastix strix TaxID=222440 RepID=A0A5J4WNV4_9EUKA|nr:MAG: hypothetical protein EZS28_007957 [Streblomastix strix]
MASEEQTTRIKIAFSMKEYLTKADRGEEVQSNTISSITGTVAYWTEAEPHNQEQYWYFWLKPITKRESYEAQGDLYVYYTSKFISDTSNAQTEKPVNFTGLSLVQVGIDCQLERIDKQSD